MKTKEEFEKLAGIRLIEVGGKLVYNDNLNLWGRKDITELPDNLKVLGYLQLNGSGVTKLPKGLEVERWLSISWTYIEELPEDIKLGGNLYMDSMDKSFTFPKILKIDGELLCTDNIIKRMPEELYVKKTCYFSESTFDKSPKVMEICGSLVLRSTPITELPEGLKEVYGNLDIYNTNITKLNDNLVVYSSFVLGYTQIEELPKGLIIGGELNLGNTNLRDYSNLHKVCSELVVSKEKYDEIKDSLAKHSKELIWGDVCVTFEPNYNGAYLFENEIGRYIKVDWYFGKIVEQEGNVYHIKTYYSDSIRYLVTDGEGKWSYGETLGEAKADLIYKVSNKNKDSYKDLTLDSELSFEDAIVCYRVITGIYPIAIKEFIKNKLNNIMKDSYTIKEFIELTKGEYGDKVFREFFCKD